MAQSTNKGEEMSSLQYSSDTDFDLVYPSEVSDSSCDSTADDEIVRQLPQKRSEFIKSCIQRRIICSNMLQAGSVDKVNVKESGERLTVRPEVDDVLIGAATFKIRHISVDNRVLHIILLCVRRSWRGKGIGRLFIDLIKAPIFSGNYNAIVVHADMDAQSFFARSNFTDDLLINQSWSELAGEYTNCKLMTYLPGFVSKDERTKMREIDNSISSWRLQVENAHREQTVCFYRLREEIESLNRLVEQKDMQISRLVRDHAEILDIITTVLCRDNGDELVESLESLRCTVQDKLSQFKLN